MIYALKKLNRSSRYMFFFFSREGGDGFVFVLETGSYCVALVNQVIYRPPI